MPFGGGNRDDDPVAPITWDAVILHVSDVITVSRNMKDVADNSGRSTGSPSSNVTLSTTSMIIVVDGSATPSSRSGDLIPKLIVTLLLVDKELNNGSPLPDEVIVLHEFTNYIKRLRLITCGGDNAGTSPVGLSTSSHASNAGQASYPFKQQYQHWQSLSLSPTTRK